MIDSQMPNYRKLRPPFSLEIRNGKIFATFLSKALANDFGRFEFYSRVLHSLKPDANHVLQGNDRLDVEIKGWAKGITWKRESETKFIGYPTSVMERDIGNQLEILRNALPGALKAKKSSSKKSFYCKKTCRGK